MPNSFSNFASSSTCLGQPFFLHTVNNGVEAASSSGLTNKLLPHPPSSVCNKNPVLSNVQISNNATSNQKHDNDTPYTKAVSEVMSQKGKQQKTVKRKLFESGEHFDHIDAVSVKLPWIKSATDGPPKKKKCSKTVTNLSNKVEKLIKSLVCQDIDLAFDVFLNLVESVPFAKKRMREVMTHNEALSIENQVGRSVSQFLKHHASGGQRSSDVQKAVDSVLIATTFGLEGGGYSDSDVAKFTGSC